MYRFDPEVFYTLPRDLPGSRAGCFLECAAWYRPAMAQKMPEDGADVRKAPFAGADVLRAAVNSRSGALVWALLDRGAGIDTPGRGEWTPLTALICTAGSSSPDDQEYALKMLEALQTRPDQGTDWARAELHAAETKSYQAIPVLEAGRRWCGLRGSRLCCGPAALEICLRLSNLGRLVYSRQAPQLKPTGET